MKNSKIVVGILVVLGLAALLYGVIQYSKKKESK